MEGKTLKAELLINILQMFDPQEEVFLHYTAGGQGYAKLAAFIDSDKIQLVIGEPIQEVEK